MIVLIDGEGASGKTVLRSLLDGHPQLAVLPIHDMLVDVLIGSDPVTPWLEYKDFPYLRHLLSTSSYYQLEQLSLIGSIEVDISVRDRLTIPFDFNFESFEATWRNNLYAMESWTIPRILAAIYEAYKYTLAAQLEPESPLSMIHVAVGFDDPATPTRLFDRIPDAKLLYLRRSTEGILAARANRRPSERDMSSHANAALTVEELLRRDKAHKIKHRFAAISELAHRMPEQVQIIEFEDLVLDTERTMRRVAAFLGIEMADCLTLSTLNGYHLITESGDTYVGKVLDRPDSLLSPNQRALIALDSDWRLLRFSHLFNMPLIYRAAEVRATRISRRLRQRLRNAL